MFSDDETVKVLELGVARRFDAASSRFLRMQPSKQPLAKKAQASPGTHWAVTLMQALPPGGVGLHPHAPRSTAFISGGGT